MDPIAHTFTGMALAAAGLRRATPLAATALFMGVNAPDVDVFTGVMGEYQSIAWRRGWTHGVLAATRSAVEVAERTISREVLAVLIVVIRSSVVTVRGYFKRSSSVGDLRLSPS
jgi:hypothetical protein